MTRTVNRLERTQLLERPVEDVFAFYADAANLEAITPPFLHFRILTPTPIAMRVGTRIEYALSLHGVPVRWRTLISRWEPGVCFVDEQESGPYALWRHTHTFEPRGTFTLMRDVVEYREPFGALGRLAHVLVMRRMLDRIFDYRQDATGHLLGRASRALSAAIEASTSLASEVRA